MTSRVDGTAQEARDETGSATRALIIDADRTIVGGDLLIESVVAYVKRTPANILQVLGWLTRGVSTLKSRLAESDLEGVELPLHPGLAGYAAQAAEEGRRVHLSSARCGPLMATVASRSACITGTLDVEVDGGGREASRIEALFRHAPDGFDYATGSRRGVSVRRYERQPLPIQISDAPEVARFQAASLFAELARGLRPHQWAKNVIVFVPLILGGQLADVRALGHTLLAFVALGCIASATYLINDVLDQIDDRRHWSKRERPIASRRLSSTTALSIAAVIILSALALAAAASLPVFAMLLTYLLVTFAYSLGLKRIPILDGLVLATLFTVRLALGAAASEVPPSPWLFVFSMFLFASLSYAKRYTEIARVIERQDVLISGRGYRTMDAPLMLGVGIASGIGAVLIMVLYIVEDAFRYSFYGSTAWLWGFPPLVFLFVMRIWLVSARGGMSDDPVSFAIRDWPCLALLGLLFVCFAFAWLG